MLVKVLKKNTLSPGKEDNNIFYDPTEYDLVLVSYVDESVIFKIPYGTSTESAGDYIPTPRYAYQSFAGWYLDQECEGEEVDLTTKLMPDFNLTLFAKWDRTPLKVRLVDDNSNIDQEAIVLYGDLVEEIPNIEDDSFVGWVKDGSNFIIDFSKYTITKMKHFTPFMIMTNLLNIR